MSLVFFLQFQKSSLSRFIPGLAVLCGSVVLEVVVANGVSLLSLLACYVHTGTCWGLCVSVYPVTAEYQI